MKSPLRYWAGFACLLLSPFLNAALTVDVDVQTTPTPQVTITWNSQGSNDIEIARRPLGDMGIGTWSIIATNVSSPYTDTTVVDGESYEYSVRSLTSNRFGNRLTHFVATINAPLNEERGAVLIVVEDTWVPELTNELASLEMSLAGDGWVVERLEWGREGTGNEEDLKAAIQAAVANNPDINSLLFFGATPMVKSGWIAPDGHASHAHETDTFFADLDGQWDDTADYSNYTPGDGIYDESYYPSTLELRTGRVTFHSMSGSQKNEVEYLRDYIHKEHAYRNGHRDVPYRNLTSDESHLFASNATLRAMVGAGNYLSSGTLNVIVDEPYLFAFSLNNGSWDEARDNYMMSIFTACFRSHIQEFWSSNNKMRRILAQPDWGLTALWGGRPAWYLHKMAAGLPIGVSVIETQNDYIAPNYSGGYIQSRDYEFNSDAYSSTSKPLVSNNLMGDPTARIVHVDAVSELTIARTDVDNIQLNWTASPASDLIGYHVYSSNDRLGPYTRLTATPITDLFYDTAAASDVDTWFQVKAVANVSVETGVYTDISQGRFALAKDDGSVNTPPLATDFDVVGKVNTPQWFQFPGTDVDGDTLTPILLKNPDNGMLRWYQGQPYYVSQRDEPGVDTATFVMFDGVTVSEPATATFTTSQIGDTLLGWEFPDNTKGPVPTTHNQTHISSTGIAGGPGTDVITSWPGTDSITSRSIGSSLDPSSNYFHWTVTPESGFRMSLDRINMGICGNDDDSISYELRVSTDGFSSFEVVPMNLSNIQGEGYGGNSGTLDSADVSGVALLQNQGQPVEFRLHFWHTGGSSTVGIGKITDPVYYDAIEDVSFIGTITTDVGLPVILATATTIDVPETDETSIAVSLSAPPASPITVDVNYVSGDTDLSVTTGSLNFDATNWNIEQTVTFAAAYDADVSSDNAVFEIVSTGLGAVVLNVNEVDSAEAPFGVEDTYQVTLDTTLNVDAASGVLANDTDANGETLTATLIDDVVHGTLTLNSDGSFDYEPETGFDGIDTFSYQASDGVLQSEVTTVTLGIVSTNLKVLVHGQTLALPVLSYAPSQDDNPTVTILGGRSVTIDGNGWKMLDLTSVDITADTVLEFDFSSTYEGEIHGIGFDNDETTINADNTFQVYGVTSNWSSSHQLENYDSDAPNTKHYAVNVGAYYTGTFRYLFFVGDDDAGPLGNGTFSNIRIYNPTPASEWASAVGLDPFTNAELGDDANGDGKSNAYYFALNMDPLNAGGREPKVATEPQSDTGSEYLTITAPFRLGTTFTGGSSDPVDGIVYEIVGDSDMMSPFGDLAVEEVTPALDAGLPALNDYDDTPGADWVYRTFRITSPMAAGDAGFIWIDVNEAP